MGLSYPLWIACFVLAKAKFFGVIVWPYNKSFITQACSVKMAGYWLCSFFPFYGHRLCQYPAIVTSCLVNNACLGGWINSFLEATVTLILTVTVIMSVSGSKTLLVTWSRNVMLILTLILMHC